MKELRSVTEQVLARLEGGPWEVELLVWGAELLVWAAELVALGAELAALGAELVALGAELVALEAELAAALGAELDETNGFGMLAGSVRLGAVEG